jgi:hypothetical protein
MEMFILKLKTNTEYNIHDIAVMISKKYPVITSIRISDMFVTRLSIFKNNKEFYKAVKESSKHNLKLFVRFSTPILDEEFRSYYDSLDRALDPLKVSKSIQNEEPIDEEPTDEESLSRYSEILDENFLNYEDNAGTIGDYFITNDSVKFIDHDKDEYYEYFGNDLNKIGKILKANFLHERSHNEEKIFFRIHYDDEGIEYTDLDYDIQVGNMPSIHDFCQEIQKTIS